MFCCILFWWRSVHWPGLLCSPTNSWVEVTNRQWESRSKQLGLGPGAPFADADHRRVSQEFDSMLGKQILQERDKNWLFYFQIPGRVEGIFQLLFAHWLLFWGEQRWRYTSAFRIPLQKYQYKTRWYLHRKSLFYFRNTILEVLRRICLLVKHTWWTSYGCRLKNCIQAYMMNAAFQLAWAPSEPSRNRNSIGNLQFYAGWCFSATQIPTVQDSVPGHPALSHGWEAVVGLKPGRGGVGKRSLGETMFFIP